MRPTKYDSFLLVFLLVVFLYCLFIMGGTPIYWVEGSLDAPPHWNPYTKYLKGVEFPTALYIIPLLFLYIFLLNVFKDELRDVSIRSSLGKVKTKITFYILRRRYT